MKPIVNSAFSKRVKRHVSGRDHLFFVNTAPGLSQLCLSELRSILDAPKTVIKVSGGIEFTGRLTDCFAANLSLRTASRVLMRITTFKATNFRQLEKNLFRQPWELYLKPHATMHINVATRHSRLFHKTAVAEKVQQSIAERWTDAAIDSGEGDHPEFRQKIFVRAVDDRFTVSLDSSGAHLHKRGLRTSPGRAPIRETLAAAVLKWSGYRPGLPLLDPMCGSGTFSIEAALMTKQIPAGFFRPFAFMEWPAFRLRQWNYLKQSSEKSIQQMVKPSIFASDKDPGSVRRFGAFVEENGLSDAIKTDCKDFFSLSPKDITNRTGLVVLNPPYGHRLGNPNRSRRDYEAIIDKLASDFNGWKFALIAPQLQLKEHHFKRIRSHPLFHGGLKMQVLTGRVS
jgi:putative N6-adenine-specific DNA methylase